MSTAAVATTGRWTPVWASVLGGVALGALDFLWIKVVPFPLGGLGNSSAVWAVVAFVFAYRLRRGPLVSVLGSVVLLVLAVPSYYLTAVLVQADDPGAVWSPVWTAFAVVAGVVFGAAGSLAHGRRQVPALAVPVAVLFAEAGLLAARVGDPNHDAAELLGQAAIEVGLGVLVTLVVRATRRRRAAALLLAAPLAVLGFVLFRVAGFA